MWVLAVVGSCGIEIDQNIKEEKNKMLDNEDFNQFCDILLHTINFYGNFIA